MSRSVRPEADGSKGGVKGVKTWVMGLGLGEEMIGVWLVGNAFRV